MSRLMNYVPRFFRAYDIYERMVRYEDGIQVLMEVNKIDDDGKIMITTRRDLTSRERKIAAKNPHLVCGRSEMDYSRISYGFARMMCEIRSGVDD